MLDSTQKCPALLSDICNFLANNKMITQLVVVMVSIGLVLLHPIAEVLMCLDLPPPLLCTSEWVALYKMGNIKPGIAILVGMWSISRMLASSTWAGHS